MCPSKNIFDWSLAAQEGGGGAKDQVLKQMFCSQQAARKNHSSHQLPANAACLRIAQDCPHTPLPKVCNTATILLCNLWKRRAYVRSILASAWAHQTSVPARSSQDVTKSHGFLCRFTQTYQRFVATTTRREAM